MGRHSAPRAPRRTVRRVARRVAPFVVLAAVGSTSWGVANASFSARSTTTASTWSTGTVVLTNTPSSALFTATGLQPGSTGTSCVDVSYTGSLAAAVRLYGSVSPSGASTLSAYLQITVEEATGTCASPGTYSTLYSGTAYAFSTVTASYATGVSSWAPSASASHPFRITYSLLADNAARGLSGSVTFTWEARNT